MHEQIKKLYDKAWAETTDHHATMQKFAELIVQECMGVVSRKCASPTAYQALAEHFGVSD
jgi:hypothetical protein